MAAASFCKAQRRKRYSEQQEIAKNKKQLSNDDSRF
jgi:hypothetical protein